jgi:chitin synthase
VVTLPEEERIAWVWCIVIAFAVPEIGTLFRSIRMCVFKSWKKPLSSHFLLVFVMESFHVIGLAMLFLAILPELDVVKGVMLTNCVCFVPGLLGNVHFPLLKGLYVDSVEQSCSFIDLIISG